MVFSSLEFLCLFMPIFFGVYYLTPPRWRNAALLAGSLCFYAVGTWRQPLHFCLFLAAILLDFYAGAAIERVDTATRKKAILAAAVSVHLLVLCIYKYSGFLFGELHRFFSLPNIAKSVVLPIGISFYTFQGISYLADVYRKKIRAEQSLLDYAVYLSMFPQLIAGPIVTYSCVQGDLHRARHISFSAAREGFCVFVFGLGMKVLLANPLGRLWAQANAIGYDSLSVPLAWLCLLAFTLQIYLDFYGYSLMAVGLGKMLGFSLPQNFCLPYLSGSMTEFWRRWHKTLSAWFRDYVYIPLGGNRGTALQTVRNLAIVWILTGIWHGAGYNFLLWGVLLFLVLCAEKFCIGRFLEKHIRLGRLYMAVLIPCMWAVFAVETPAALGAFFGRLFGIGVPSAAFAGDFRKYFLQYLPVLAVGLLFSTRLPVLLLQKVRKGGGTAAAVTAIFLAGSLYCMYRGLDDPFLYFRF